MFASVLQPSIHNRGTNADGQHTVTSSGEQDGTENSVLSGWQAFRREAIRLRLRLSQGVDVNAHRPPCSPTQIRAFKVPRVATLVGCVICEG